MPKAPNPPSPDVEPVAPVDPKPPKAPPKPPKLLCKPPRKPELNGIFSPTSMCACSLSVVRMCGVDNTLALEDDVSHLSNTPKLGSVTISPLSPTDTCLGGPSKPP